ncbi:hypothetical protein [Anaerocolumna xylanovorans]|uniref:Nitrogen regulatory protein P-II family n=1 Tax=Anaerocolumna xylanovorans DSM 12503 TaxID=1121345 RepID=A0A1M7Y0G8_9FIRM|nr:hypothetical protein [Anaerocolumna xylanovorans]SHO45038.1 hypothetical protein SAMN02745217_00806 [Anaerocolumna xylanovorans DSM 12503]
MNNHLIDNVEYLILIAGRKQKDALLSKICDIDCRIVNTIYGKGTVKCSYLMDMLGFVPEENKVIITCILPKDKTDAIFKILLNEFDFGRPNTGIAFTLPILGMAF